jgi:hypothetical protein
MGRAILPANPLSGGFRRLSVGLESDRTPQDEITLDSPVVIGARLWNVQ